MSIFARGVLKLEMAKPTDRRVNCNFERKPHNFLQTDLSFKKDWRRIIPNNNKRFPVIRTEEEKPKGAGYW